MHEKWRVRGRPRAAMVAAAILAAACVGSPGSSAATADRPAPSESLAAGTADRIVYLANAPRDDATHVYSIRPDGTGRRRLTGGRGVDRAPAQAPDGSTVVFSRYRSFSPPRAGLYAVDKRGRGLSRLTRSAKADFETVWDPAGERLAFVRSPFRPEGAEEDFSAIYVLEVGGGAATRVTPVDSRNDSPTWAPDGSKVAFASNRADVYPNDLEAGRWDVWVMDADGSNSVNLTGAAAGDDPSWAPDGAAIVYERYEEQGSNLWVTDPEGLNHRRLTTGCEYTQDPVWSHDSQWVAYTIVSSGCQPADEDRIRNHVAVVRVSDGAVVDADLTLRESFSPSWAPDTNTLVFVGRRKSTYDLFGFAVGSERLKQITSGPGGEADPAWLR